MGATILEVPSACTAGERRAFARLVRRGFPHARRLGRRVRDAERLAFQYSPAGDLLAVAALKRPGLGRRREIFARAETTLRPADYPVELGWVFVSPEGRRAGTGRRLCRRLVRSAPRTSLFATTRVTNRGMRRILASLGFARAGKPFSRNGDRLVLFVGRERRS